ncbi:hypothetical protein KI387_028223, partial [Taxus chinensis]
SAINNNTIRISPTFFIKDLEEKEIPVHAHVVSYAEPQEDISLISRKLVELEQRLVVLKKDYVKSSPDLVSTIPSPPLNFALPSPPLKKCKRAPVVPFSTFKHVPIEPVVMPNPSKSSKISARWATKMYLTRGIYLLEWASFYKKKFELIGILEGSRESIKELMDK